MTSPRAHTILYLDHTAKISGGEIALLNLVNALDKTRFRPLVLLASDGPLVGRLYAAGVETHVLPLDAAIVNARKDTLGASGLLGRVRQVFLLRAYAARVARWARAQGVSLIHTNSLKSDIYGGLAGRMAGIPVIWHVRDRLADGYLPRAAAMLFRLTARVLPQMVVANSESTLSTLHLSPRKRSAVVYSGVPSTGPFTPSDPSRMVVYDGVPTEQFAAPVRAVDPSAPVVSLFGRIAPWKGQHVFLEAAARVGACRPDVRFRIVGAPLFGEQEYEESLHTLARQLNMESRVEFLGFRDDVPALLAETDIVVHASTLGEPFGQVVVEGMASGKPVIATDGGALPEIIRDGESGVLVRMGDSSALAEAMKGLLADPARARAIGLAGQDRVRERFTIEHTARTMETAYDHLLSLTRTRARSGRAALTPEKTAL